MRRLVLGAAGLAVAIAVAGTTYAVAAVSTQKAPAVAAARHVHPPRCAGQPGPARLRPRQGAGRRPAVEGRLRPDDGPARTPRCRARPSPAPIVECGSYSNPNNGCTDEREDAIAAYTDALAWYITRDSRYAKKAIEIMDAWSAVIKDHTNSNAPLQTGWAGSSWPRAAEIIQYTYTGWPNAGALRHHAAHRLPAEGHQRLQQQRQLGTDA